MLLVLIIAGFVILRVPRRLSGTSCCNSFGILPGLPLLAGTLLLKYSAVRFAGRVPTWRLPVSGHAACLVTAESGVAEVVGVEVGGGEEVVGFVVLVLAGREFD